MTGQRPPELNGPELPHGLHYLWAWFCDLARQRQAGMSASPMSWSDLSHWATRSGIDPTPWEWGCLTALDHALLASQDKKGKK